jgi:hypothetical protein
MPRLRMSITTGLVAALAISAMAVPAAAAGNRHAAIVNGAPDTRVDVCIGSSREIRSSLKYGGVFKTSLNGKKQFQFRKASGGVCKGKLIASRWVKFPAGADKTIVVTSSSPSQVLVFSNAELGVLASPTYDASPAIRHAADLKNNNVYLRRTIWQNPSIVDDIISPSAVGTPFTKDSEFRTGLVTTPNMVMRIKATRISADAVLVRAPLVQLEPMKRCESIFLGNKKSNAKITTIVSDLASPPQP